ncbi:MAG: hypothetical protein K2O05_01080, partial [Anaeroplasmataceae bacterium]|nr:hypothetical protein [Anaeroplasmataceae bacterium]
MKILSHSGNEVYVGHFQGNAVKHYLDVVEEFSLKKVNISPRVSVITAYTDHEKAITALQLELSRMPYVNACPNDSANWSNVDKIKYFVSALEQTTSEYCLLADGYDVLFFRDIDEEFITKFEEKEKKILFNATKNKYPKISIG